MSSTSRLRSRLSASASALASRNRLPGFRPDGEIGGRNEPLGEALFLWRGALARGREADQPLDQPKQQRQIKLEPLGIGHAGEPLDIAMQPRTVDLRQGGECGDDFGVKLDALA